MKKENEKFTVVCSRFQKLKFCHFSCCFVENREEMYQNVKRSRRVIVSSHKTYSFVVLSMSSRRRRCLSSPLLG